ncbi:putative ribonuclease H-like domain-containing protein [Tanacetum coccineum]
MLKQGAPLILNMLLTLMKSLFLLFSTRLHAYNSYVEDLATKLMKMLWKKFEIRWQGAMDNSKSNNVVKKKRIVAIEDSTSKAFVTSDWSMEFDARTCAILDIDGLGGLLTGSNKDVVDTGFGIESSNSMESDISSGDETLTDLSKKKSSKEKSLQSSTSATVNVFLTIQNSAGQESRTTGLGNKGGNYVAIQKKISMDSMLIIDSGCSGRKEPFKTSCLDFEKVSYVEELRVYLLTVSKSVIGSTIMMYTSGSNENIIHFWKGPCLVARQTNDDVVFYGTERLGALGNNTGLLAKRLKKELSENLLELAPHGLVWTYFSREYKQGENVCLVVTDDCSKFSWVFFLAYKDETYDMLHDLIVGLENRLRHKVKTIRCDNGTEFKNQLMNEFCAKKGIKREYSYCGTPQLNWCCMKRKIRTSIEAARTMQQVSPSNLFNLRLDAVNYVAMCFNRPFGCSLTILNTLDQLGKFDGKSEEGYLLGYSTSSKGFRVYNRVTRKVQECLHVNFLENQENQKGKGPDWMFDLDLLTPFVNFITVRTENYADYGDKVSTLVDVKI